MIGKMLEWIQAHELRLLLERKLHRPAKKLGNWEKNIKSVNHNYQGRKLQHLKKSFTDWSQIMLDILSDLGANCLQSAAHIQMSSRIPLPWKQLNTMNPDQTAPKGLNCLQ